MRTDARDEGLGARGQGLGARGQGRAGVLTALLALVALALPRAATGQAAAAVRVGVSGAPVAAFAHAAPPRAALGTPQEAAPRRGVSAGEVIGGVVGSAAGMWGGVLVVYGVGSSCGDDCSDGAFGAGVAGLVAGSIVGTAVGTHLGAKAAHRPTGGFGHRIGAAALGLLAGLAAFEAVGSDADEVVSLTAFPLAQGIVGAWLGRAR